MDLYHLLSIILLFYLEVENMNIPVKELFVTETTAYSLDDVILEARKKDNKDSNRYFILCKNLNKNLIDLLHSDGANIGELLDTGFVEVISNMVVHIIDEEADANHFIYSDYASITDRACDRYYEVYHVFTEKKYRGKGISKEFVNIVLSNIYNIERNFNNEVCIFAQAGISMEEYPEDPYKDENADEKIGGILDKVISFYEKCGFIEVNKISDFDNSCNMYFAPDHASASVIEFYKKAWKSMYDAYLEKVKQVTKLTEKIESVKSLLENMKKVDEDKDAEENKEKIE